MRNGVLVLAAAIALAFGFGKAAAAELKVLVSGAMAHALEEISRDFAAKNGHTLDFIVGTTGALQERVRAGEAADVIEVTSAGMDALEQENLVVPGTRVELARALIAVAVAQDAPAPDISTPETLREALLAARSVAFIDPRLGGQAGAAITGLLRRLGIADEVAGKSVYGRTGAEAVEKMVAGEADLAISFVSEILPIGGAKLVGPLPPAVQNPSTYAAAIGARSANPEIARALLQAMTTAEARDVITHAGLEPLPAR